MALKDKCPTYTSELTVALGGSIVMGEQALFTSTLKELDGHTRSKMGKEQVLASHLVGAKEGLLHGKRREGWAVQL